MMFRSKYLPLFIGLSALPLSGCGAAAAVASASNALSAALATFGVSAPSATGSAPATMLTSAMPAKPHNGFTPTADVDASDVKSAEEKAKDLVERLDATTAASCVANLNITFKNRPNLKCFGSQFAVSNTYDISGTSFNTALSAGAFSGGGMHPGGDSGMLVATEPDTGEACASATTNAYVSYAAQGVSITQDLFAAGLCLANLAGKTLPADGESLDLLATIGDNMTGITFTAFTLSKGTDGYTLTASGSSASQDFNITSVNDHNDTTDAGKVFGYFEFTAGQYFGFSVNYTKTGSDASIDYRSSIANSTSIVNSTTGALDYSAGSGNMFYIKLKGTQSDTDVNGAMLFAWQAGAGDSHARVFQSSVIGTDGEAYFGYGPKISLSANEADYGEITGMICNWALTAASSHTPVANKAEKQTFTLTDGKFVPVDSYISYAPYNTCNGHTADYTMGVGQQSGGNDFNAYTFTGATWTIASTMTNDLQTLAGVSAGLGIPSDPRE